jgi:uncharacterized protein (TIGR02145 family)
MAVCRRNGIKFNKAIKLAVTIATLGMFIACGDDSGSSAPEQTSESISDTDLVVKTFDDLPVCSNKREGSTAYVKDEKVAYVCEDGDWTPDSDENVDKKSSSSGKASSSSSKKTQSSSSSDKAKSSSSGKASSSSNFRYEQNSSAYFQPKVVAIKNKSISGLSQKGPFVTGSTVKFYELDGKTFAQTGKSFSGKITSDDGTFSVSNVSLASQYALLEVTGYFRNEVTGEKSKGTITLNALTDLSDRKNVNINLLTHLEYERVLHLIESGINFTTAKKQAESEILSAFGINGEFANSEDLDIFGKGDDNAALLAISVLILGGSVDEYDYHKGLGEAELTEHLSKFATDIAKDGSWDDENTKATIADRAATYSRYEADDYYRDYNGFSNIRQSIEKWNLGAVPDFEKYVRNFWTDVYGLGKCDSKNEGEVVATKNERSNNYGTEARYICKDGTWKYASVLEKDFYKSGKDSGDDGELWIGLLTGRVYKYDKAQKKWFDATRNDDKLKLNGCTTNRSGEISKSSTDDIYYVCKNMDWQKALDIDLDTYGTSCTSKEVGKIINGEVSGNNRYYCSENGWVSLMDWSWNVPKETRLNPEITYGSMTDSRDKKVYKTVKIGDQVWMAENLNYADSAKTPSLKGKNWCYRDSAKYCEVGGRFYTWAAAIDSIALYDGGNGVDCGSGKTCTSPAKVQGICPNGWHLPSSTEWNVLFDAVAEVERSMTVDKILKSQTGWRISSDGFDGNGTDGLGFSALPVNYINVYNDGNHRNGERNAYFWSSTEIDDLNAYGMMLLFGAVVDVGVFGSSKYDGFSIRCLKD